SRPIISTHTPATKLLRKAKGQAGFRRLLHRSSVSRVHGQPLHGSPCKSTGPCPVIGTGATHLSEGAEIAPLPDVDDAARLRGDAGVRGAGRGTIAAFLAARLRVFGAPLCFLRLNGIPQ